MTNTEKLNTEIIPNRDLVTETVGKKSFKTKNI